MVFCHAPPPHHRTSPGYRECFDFYRSVTEIRVCCRSVGLGDGDTLGVHVTVLGILKSGGTSVEDTVGVEVLVLKIL